MWAPDRTLEGGAGTPAPVVAHPDRGGPGVDRWLLERAAEDGVAAAVWEPTPSLVVPGSYRRHAGFDAACARSTAQGWPVIVRRSGGGLVPQGPGMLNLSMAWRTCAAMGEMMTPVYKGLCELLQEVIEPFGIDTDCQAVSGSFCDGRYNLAWGGRKVAGTAQYWHRLNAQEHVVLAHAVLLVEADVITLTAQANAFESLLGTDTRYQRSALTTLVPASGVRPTDLHGVALDTRLLMQRLSEAARQRAALC